MSDVFCFGLRPRVECIAVSCLFTYVLLMSPSTSLLFFYDTHVDVSSLSRPIYS